MRLSELERHYLSINHAFDIMEQVYRTLYNNTSVCSASFFDRDERIAPVGYTVLLLITLYIAHIINCFRRMISKRLKTLHENIN